MGLRRLMYRCLNFWLLILDFWSAKLIKPGKGKNLSKLKSWERFLAENKERQEELRRCFVNYHHFCHTCQKCCEQEIIKILSATDFILYDIEYYHLYYTDFKSIIDRFCFYFMPRTTISKLIQFIKNGKMPHYPNLEARPIGGADHVCRSLSENGCIQPFGLMPAICTLYLCEILMDKMSWKDYWQYWRTSCKYLSYLTLSLAHLEGLAREPIG